jgi:hypothetical protein
VTAAPGVVRPTIRCLREDLGHAKLPPASLPLDRLDLPVLRKAQEVCRTDPPATGRITSIDDQVLWKVKIERWRGAVWCDLPRRWLVAAGRREAGSPDDFYADLTEKGRRWRAEHNRASTPPVTTGTLVLRLLPAADDQDRIRLEQAVAAVDELRTVVGELVITSARSGAEQSDEAGGCAIAVLVRRTEYDEVYIGVRIVGPVQETVTAVILAAVPAVADPAGWFLDAMPGRSAAQGELVWSNLLDQTKLNDLLQEDSSER